MAKFIFSYKFILLLIIATFSSSLLSCSSNGSKRELISPVHKQYAGEIWNGEIDETWFLDNKSEFHISTAQELAGVCSLVGTDYTYLKNKKIVLDEDIYLNQINEDGTFATDDIHYWSPIGCQSNSGTLSPFQGVFDGNSHKIVGMYINEDSVVSYKADNSSAGLFGAVSIDTPDSSLSIYNLSIQNSTIELNNARVNVDYIGSAVGFFSGGGLYGKFNGLMNVESNCYINTINKTGNYYGGLVGYSQCNVFNCSYTGILDVRDTTAYVGGITGGGATPCFVLNSYSTADLYKSSLNAFKSGTISYHSIPFCCYYLKNKINNKSNYAFGSLRRIEERNEYKPYGNGTFESKESSVVISTSKVGWANDARIYGDNVLSVNYDGFVSIVEALNSFSFKQCFSYNNGDDSRIAKWIVDSFVNDGFPYLNYE